MGHRGLYRPLCDPGRVHQALISIGVADSAKARALLGWTPRYTDFASIIETA